MTRATLLHVLDRPTALGPDEVRELEQLAQTFPYCQTAHLLLAKAAHDQGTMLAGQRLRRAATYAADRTLLRRLIEQMEPAAVTAPTAEEGRADSATPVSPAPTEATASAAVPAIAEAATQEAVTPTEPATSVAAMPPASQPEAVPVPPEAAVETPELSHPAPALPLPMPILALPESTETSPETPTSEATPVADPAALVTLPEAAVPEVKAPESAASPPIETSIEAAPADAEIVAPAAREAVIEAAALTPQPEALAEEAAVPSVPESTSETAPELPLETPVLVDLEGTQIPVLAETDKTFAGTTPEHLPELAVPGADEELPAQAPAIRPPVEVGEARFEYGLAEALPPPSPVYEFPGLVDEFAASAVTRSLGSSDLPAILLEEAAAAAPQFTPAAFTGDATVGYAYGESSRLGLSMQLLDLLTAKAETAETNTTIVAAAQPPAVALPPVGTYFEPDPLLLDHWATHQPPPPALPSTLDLINNFLKRQPRLTRPAMLPATPSHQADLSVRSTRAEPDLVSENLARIFVRQGKTVRAIEIYEKLMVKHPEKMAYFAAQIQLLQPSV